MRKQFWFKRKSALRRIAFLLCVFSCSLSVFAQGGRTLKGTISDTKGDPVIGASIAVKGTSTGNISDADGNFSLQVAPNAVLVVSYLGYKTQEAPTGNQSFLSIVLEEDHQLLNEVVVVGYGTQKKVNLTGSVATISAEDLANKPIASTSAALAGLASGLSVVQGNGRPGKGATVKIRGTGTFSSAKNDPMVLIDGLLGNLDDIDPSDIGSISLLKDAASASVYGNRAANGVILIETKRGKEGKVTISYNNSFGWQKVTEFPDYLPSWEYATYFNEAEKNDGITVPRYSEADIQKYKDGSDPDNYPNVNHLRSIMESGSGFQQRHNVSVQGGNAKNTYNLSVGYWDINGVVARTGKKRYTALLSLKNEIAAGFTLNTNINAFSDDYEEPKSVINSRLAPIYAGRKSDGTYGNAGGTGHAPQADLESNSFDNTTGKNLKAVTQLQWETPVEGLTISGRAGLTYNTYYNKSFSPVIRIDENTVSGRTDLTITSGNTSYTITEALATYKKEIGQHSFQVLAGVSGESSVEQWISANRKDFPNNYLHEIDAGSASTSTNSGNSLEESLLSFFGRINYSFNDRYLLEANLRYDGSSRFAPANRWGVFPSVSAGWRISEEAFWKESSLYDLINQFKLRVSRGVLGNQNIGLPGGSRILGYYPYQQIYSLSGFEYPLGDPVSYQAGAGLSSYNDPNISWETTSVTDIGLDFMLFDGKLSGTLDYFNKYTDNILSAVEVAYIMGFSVGQSNVGAVSNKGFEFSLTYNTQIGKDFHLSIAPNFTYVKNAVEKLANGRTEDINNGRFVGEPLGVLYGYKSEGLFVDQAEIDASPDIAGKAALKPGDIRYSDLSGPNGVPDGKVDPEYDRVIIGSTTPKYYYGFNLGASYKNFDFSALLQGLGGYQNLLTGGGAQAFYQQGQIQRWQAENRFDPANPDKWAKYLRLGIINDNSVNSVRSDYWIRDNSFLRLKSVQLGYTLPKKVSKKIAMEQLRFFLTGDNLLNFHSFYQGWDPENDLSDYYPINSIFSFGLNIKF